MHSRLVLQFELGVREKHHPDALYRFGKIGPPAMARRSRISSDGGEPRDVNRMVVDVSMSTLIQPGWRFSPDAPKLHPSLHHWIVS